MKKTLLIILLATINIAFAQNKNIQFETGTWDDILARAKRENKPIFLDAYASWCGPCKWMAANVFTKAEVADYFNAGFVNAKIDMEKGEGVDLAKKYEVQAYPTLLVISADGEMIHRFCGALQAEPFIKWGKESFEEDKQFGRMHRTYLNGERSSEFMLNYINQRDLVCMDAETVAEEYFNAQKEEVLFEKQNWEIFYEHIWNSDSKSFKYVAENYSKFFEKFEDKVDAKIANVYSRKIHQAIRKKDDNTYETNLKILKSLSFYKAQKAAASVECDYYYSKQDWLNYATKSVSYIETYKVDNPYELNSFAWNFYEKIKDKSMLEKAAQWSKKTIEKEDNYAFNDTYAAILYKLGNKKEAQKYAETAIVKAKEEEINAKETEELLKKIKALK
jgi:thiol-disulfide isomerase/thioredoxin